MRKNSDWNSVPAYDGESTALKPGAYICKVVGMKEEQTKTGKTMVVLAFDIAEGEYEDYYRKRFDREKKDNKDVKYKGRYYVFPTNNDGSTNPFFKGMITAIEKSNGIILPDEFTEKDVKGKLFGGLFEREEFEEDKWYTKLVSIRTVEAIREGRYTLPEDKPLSNVSNNNTSGFSIDSDDEDEDLPF